MKRTSTTTKLELTMPDLNVMCRISCVYGCILRDVLCNSFPKPFPGICSSKKAGMRLKILHRRPLNRCLSSSFLSVYFCSELLKESLENRVRNQYDVTSNKCWLHFLYLFSSSTQKVKLILLEKYALRPNKGAL